MTSAVPRELTPRQQREVEYHRQHARAYRPRPPSFDVLATPERRWFNAYWYTYGILGKIDLSGARVLVIGSGFGDDAIRLSHPDRRVYACDLSPDSLEVALSRAATSARGPVRFQQMAAEHLAYRDNSFDVMLAVDILHHVDIPALLRELRRVARPGSILVCDEVYTHSWLQTLRESVLVTRFAYPLMKRWVYGTDAPYITQDERKMDQTDVECVIRHLARARVEYFNCVVGRLIPDRWDWIAYLDRSFLRLCGALGRFLGARVVMWGQVGK